ncbi:uncharacterized protein LOC18447794 [Amborella trichopoda]|uniref:RWP-RK domain-containing protein n=1 Tax=Amborella trichopoda TaxID=13333 RepID=U5DAZ8_AMBTC|nr:uncharacterized protein LOC18447794 [Amborella trichopoda]ERN19410.1 hypothetical protein AMTR_s00069p00159620 [Amborella trichopoda]|eukprot:XP_006857943.1 uncharacterized protein LOC18447794 [Amborella trichopoda]
MGHNNGLPGGSLTFDDVARFFSLPIAEAASLLGVCTSVLKKICRENGVLRWPYRKFQAGKTVEEIKRDAARERSKGFLDLSKSERLQDDVSVDSGKNLALDGSSSSLISPVLGSQPYNGDIISTQDIPKLQQEIPQVVQISPQPGNKILQNAKHHKSVLTYLDEFKYGFPSDGLSCISNKWWVPDNPDGIDGPENSVVKYALSTQNSANGLVVCSEEAQNSGPTICLAKTKRRQDLSDEELGGAVLLSSIRERNTEYGREALKLGFSRGYDGSKLGGRERVVLLKAFGSSLPSQWRYSFP